ncbi:MULTISPECIES: small acid-soluble spore protein SspI [unclassified Paenibacillus]|uniref:small acid-soluble spore protein SspI n=1 Tax=unclassified Paenibacillus TaxID=185978 RepID=UPI001AE268A7|nr:MULTISPECIES: small acid-soluble spore protein SspI [unclassified Paenibacillus]MBP1157070.1 small acid-soluble spore protein I (minor) [Paenibacillus sp. PvP091]MBP1172191.1 small acid-soluble spore protein I (minor) [Paenibacillus sp. PvR098]MBP2438572.1 small acid-soluble spore protein I (minor) [Paenibacillus sp. PvP052]
MNLNLRQAIIQRVHDKNDDDLKDVIEGSIDGEERLLPGLGVLFEMIWKNSTADAQNQMVHALKEQLTQAAPTA